MRKLIFLPLMFIATGCTTTRIDDHSTKTIHNYNGQSDSRKDSETTVYTQSDDQYLSNINDAPFYNKPARQASCVDMPYYPPAAPVNHHYYYGAVTNYPSPVIGRTDPAGVSPRITNSYLPNMIGNRSRY
jgi:hypothetical protein